MTIDIFTSAGTKKGTMNLPESLFEYRVNRDLIHQAIVRQKSNVRAPIAHAKNRGEVAGSTRKLFGQKHTGNARRGPIRSPVLRGGGKAFGPRNDANFVKDMPRAMRRAALRACLSFQAKKEAILGLESYPDTIKTKTLSELIAKMKLKDSRKVLFVLPEKHDALHLSSRNIPGCKTVLVSYLNPVDIIDSRALVFVGDSIDRAAAMFGKKADRTQKRKMGEGAEDTGGTEEAKEKKTVTKKAKAPAEKKVMKKKPVSKKTAAKKAASASKKKS